MIKKRNWAFVLYDESAPKDWKDILQLKGLMFAVSPYHNKDINPTGEVKKPHYHVILCFPGPTTRKIVDDIVVEELKQPHAIPLESVKGYYRYFTHKDNPEKYQYDSTDIQHFNGFDPVDILNSFEVFSHLKSIQMIINDNDINEYADLMDFLLCSELMEEWGVASTHTMFLNTYITSRRNKKLPIIDKKTTKN